MIFKARKTKWANFFNNYRTIISNDAHQEQRHQDHDAATRIQCIIRGFLTKNKMITEHTAAVIIQTHFRIFCHHRTLQDNNHKDEEARHFDEMHHLNDLLNNFVIDFADTTNKFDQITKPSRDLDPAADIIWPRHSPDPIF